MYTKAIGIGATLHAHTSAEHKNPQNSAIYRSEDGPDGEEEDIPRFCTELFVDACAIFVAHVLRHDRLPGRSTAHGHCDHTLRHRDVNEVRRDQKWFKGRKDGKTDRGGGGGGMYHGYCEVQRIAGEFITGTAGVLCVCVCVCVCV